jgi:lipopolysaccharide/colanic/teichoic acid biosynthesis glycosyltransferase
MMGQAQLLAAELCITALATVSALVLNRRFDISEADLTDTLSYLALTLASAAVILPSLQTCRSVWRFTQVADCLRILAATGLIVTLAAAFSLRCGRISGYLPGLPVVQGLLILSLLVGARIMAKVWHAVRDWPFQERASQKTPGRESVLVIGVGEVADFYLRCAARLAPDGVHVAGLLADDDRYIGRWVHGYPVLETPERIADALRNLEVHGVSVDRIVVAMAFQKLSREAQAALLAIKKATNIGVDFLTDQIGLGRGPVTKAQDNCSSAGAAKDPTTFSIGTKEPANLSPKSYWRVKRVLDPVAALALLILLAPLLLAVMIAVWIDVGSPVLFWQLRPGLSGRPFKLHKLRTMGAAYDTRGRRVPDDERTSPVGQYLRRTRLDELPQLFDILIGKMSFVGPRPLLLADQPAASAARLLVRPGLTGWAQVMGGRDISPEDKAALDASYVRNASLALDLTILAYTVRIVLFGERTDLAAIERAWQELEPFGTCASAALPIMQSPPASQLQACREMKRTC